MKNQNNRGFVGIVIIVIVALVLGAGATYYLNDEKVVELNATSTPDTSIIATTTAVSESELVIETPIPPKAPENLKVEFVNPENKWSLYKDERYGFQFQYPAKLSLKSVTADSVTLSHSIPFENRDGGCDMKGDSVLSPTLEDFNVKFEIKSEKPKLEYSDGVYQTKNLRGEWAYQGAEGCGQTIYHFPIKNNKYLVVTKLEVQILSDNVSAEVKEKISKIPGSISGFESREILDDILYSFKYSE